MNRRRELQWVRLPLQARSQRTLQRLLEAAEALLMERDFESISVSEIAQRASSSVGAFYARFHDKSGLLHVLHERFIDEAVATADEALAPERWEDCSLAEILSAMTALSIQVHRERYGLLRAFRMYGCKDEQFRQRADRLGTHLISRLQDLALSREGAVRHPDPSFALGFGLRMQLAMLDELFVLGEGVPDEEVPPPERLRQELTRAYLAYLGAPLEDNPS